MDNNINPLYNCNEVTIKKYTSKEELGSKRFIDDNKIKYTLLSECSKDSTPYVKMFIADGLIGIFTSFMKSDFMLLFYIILQIRPGKDIVKIDNVDFMGVFNVKSEKTVYNAIRKLSDSNIIRKYKPGQYWINPHVFFRGSRLKLYEQLI